MLVTLDMILLHTTNTIYTQKYQVCKICLPIWNLMNQIYVIHWYNSVGNSVGI